MQQYLIDITLTHSPICSLYELCVPIVLTCLHHSVPGHMGSLPNDCMDTDKLPDVCM